MTPTCTRQMNSTGRTRCKWEMKSPDSVQHLHDPYTLYTCSNFEKLDGLVSLAPFLNYSKKQLLHTFAIVILDSLKWKYVQVGFVYGLFLFIPCLGDLQRGQMRRGDGNGQRWPMATHRPSRLCMHEPVFHSEFQEKDYQIISDCNRDAWPKIQRDRQSPDGHAIQYRLSQVTRVTRLLGSLGYLQVLRHPEANLILLNNNRLLKYRY